MKFWRSSLSSCMVAILLLLLLSISPRGAAAAAPESKPNVLIILVDDLGFNDVGYHGSPDVKSPNIDKLARGGAQFWNTYSTAGFCSPSRASLLSGRSPQMFGYVYNPPHRPEDSTMGLPRDITILPETLQTAQYDTYMIGKWHLGFWLYHHPLLRGFTDWFGFLGGSFNYFQTFHFQNKWGFFQHIYDKWTVATGRQYATHRFTDKALEYISRSHGNNKPFFIYLAYNTPHGPYQFEEEDVDPKISPERQPHVAMIKALDDDVGRLIARLNSLGILRNTFIIFTNDNGGHSQGAVNFPLKEYKGSFHDGGIRVPFIAYWKDKIAPDQNITHPITLMDIYATVQNITNIAPNKQNPLIEGTNLIPYVRRVNERRPEASGEPHEFICLASRRKGLVRKGEMKIMLFNGWVTKLYNMTEDIGETTDLRAKYPGIVADLFQHYASCDGRQVPTLFPAKDSPNPINVTIVPPKGPYVLGLKLQFTSTVTNSKNTELTYSWEAFRPMNLHKANYNNKVAAGARIRLRANKKSAEVTFSNSGNWIVRVNVNDDRWYKWSDFALKVTKK